MRSQPRATPKQATNQDLHGSQRGFTFTTEQDRKLGKRNELIRKLHGNIGFLPLTSDAMTTERNSSSRTTRHLDCPKPKHTHPNKFIFVTSNTIPNGDCANQIDGNAAICAGNNRLEKCEPLFLKHNGDIMNLKNKTG